MRKTLILIINIFIILFILFSCENKTGNIINNSSTTNKINDKEKNKKDEINSSNNESITEKEETINNDNNQNNNINNNTSDTDTETDIKNEEEYDKTYSENELKRLNDFYVDFKSYSVNVSFNEDKTWNILLNDELNNIENFEKIKKLNYYDNNLYTYNVNPNDTLYYKFINNELNIYIKPANYIFNYNPFYEHDEHFSPNSKTNYTFINNFIISNKYYNKYNVENDYFNLIEKQHIKKYYKDFYIIKNFINTQLYYSFIKLYHNWNFIDINKLNKSNPIENDPYTTKEFISNIFTPGMSGLFRDKLYHTYTYINKNQFYSNWYYYDYINKDYIIVDHKFNYNLKEFLNYKYKNKIEINSEFKENDIITINLDFNTNIIDFYILNNNSVELNFEDIIENNDNHVIYQKNNKKFILNKNLEIFTYTDTTKNEIFKNYFNNKLLNYNIKDKTIFTNEDIKHTFYITYTKSENDDEYLINNIFTINEREIFINSNN